MSYNNHDICPFYLFIFYSATYSEHRNKKVPIVSRASASNSRFGDHSYANVQAMYLKSMASEVRTHSTSHVWLAGNEMVWTGFQWTEIKMREAWPQCSLNVLQWLLANGFYIKKFLWPNQRGSTGNFAGGGSTVYYIEGTRIDFVASTMKGRLTCNRGKMSWHVQLLLALATPSMLLHQVTRRGGKHKSA